MKTTLGDLRNISRTVRSSRLFLRSDFLGQRHCTHLTSTVIFEMSYLFFLDCVDFQIVGASPELLVKEEMGRIITHPIAGTVKRGKTLQEDEALADELRNSVKDRAEHVSSN